MNIDNNEKENYTMHAQDGCRHMQRIIEVCLLVLLCRPEGEDSHGYALGERLKEFGFEDSEISVSTLYRTLRGMEESGWVTSGWAAGGQGPQRREYAITNAGRQALDEWAAVLTRRRERIGRVLTAYGELGREPVMAETTPAIERPNIRAQGSPRRRIEPVPAEETLQPMPAKRRREDSFNDYWD
jgi:PadR family transcriptional regulator PadR